MDTIIKDILSKRKEALMEGDSPTRLRLTRTEYSQFLSWAKRTEYPHTGRIFGMDIRVKGAALELTK